MKTAAAAGASYLALKEDQTASAIPADAATSQGLDFVSPTGARQSANKVLRLLSTSEVFVPPRGRSFVKFSFDFPEPSVEFAGLRFSFRLFTFENAYTLDAGLTTVTEDTDSLGLHSTGFMWAGGQEKAPGKLSARFRRNGSFIEWDASAEIDQPIKSIAAVVRDVPRGKMASGGQNFFDTRDDEILFGYPFGGGALFTARTMDTPLVIVQSGDQDFFFISTLLDRVRATRFYFQPGEKSYRVELIHEAAGWEKSNRLQSPTWRVGRAHSLEEASRPHFEHVEQAFQLPAWEKRPDVPSWFHDVALVVALHGMHWSGYVFNDFEKMSRILEWVATQIPGQNVMVFLPAWDGRYYWNYPLYKPDPRLGGENGFRALIEKGHKQKFRFLPMFGLNSANLRHPEFAKFANAVTEQIDGDAFNLNWVDWDNDRHNEGWGPYMNVGVDSWRHWLSDRIAETLERYHADGYFLDIAGGWENNTKADMHEGTRRLVADLRLKFPDALAVGEMSYDALLGVLPVYHVYPAAGYRAAFTKYARAFQHLSLPAPGRGSSGVHESGFGRFNPQTLSLSPNQIPTITVVDDTFEKYRDVMAQIIVLAKQRAGIS
ncbi:MAG: hypothetical protein WAM91_15430 [Candidatus Acidiferrales bacterium]